MDEGEKGMKKILSTILIGLVLLSIIVSKGFCQIVVNHKDVASENQCFAATVYIYQDLDSMATEDFYAFWMRVHGNDSIYDFVWVTIETTEGTCDVWQPTEGASFGGSVSLTIGYISIGVNLIPLSYTAVDGEYTNTISWFFDAQDVDDAEFAAGFWVPEGSPLHFSITVRAEYFTPELDFPVWDDTATWSSTTRPQLSISTSSGGTTDPAPGTYTYDYGSPVTATASAYTNYAFDYWLLDGATVFENPITVMMDSDHILNAYFERIYTLNVIVQGSGVVRKAIAETGTLSTHQMPGYGVVWGSSASYATARTTPSQSVTEFLEVGQSYSSYGNLYNVERPFLKFNTTTVPSDAIITSAHLSLWGYGDGSRNWSAVIQKWTGDNPLDTNDYNQFDGTNYGSRDLSSWVDYSYNDISISNFALIQKAGYTKICLRSSNDISSTVPTGFETLRIDDWILRFPPKLVITYTYYALGEEVAGSKGYPEGTAVTLKAVPTGALSYWLLDGATVHNNPITVTMDADHNLEAYFKWVQTRYFRGDQQTINGLLAYRLGTNQSSTLQFASGMASGRLAVLWSSDVVVRHADGSETTIGTKIAQVSRVTNTEGIRSASWTCPLTSLFSTDAVVIKVYDKYGAAGAWNLRATFITERLGASRLDNVAWTFYYHTCRLFDGFDTYGDFMWGTSTYNSRIENFTWTP